MTLLRNFLLRRRSLAAWLIVTALAMRLLVPAGFMPVVSAGGVTLSLCSGSGPMTMAMPEVHGKAGHGDGQGKNDMQCPFAGLAMPGLAGADPILLLLAIAFVMAGAFMPPPAPVLPRAARLRPPPVGPPALT